VRACAGGAVKTVACGAAASGAVKPTGLAANAAERYNTSAMREREVVEAACVNEQSVASIGTASDSHSQQRTRRSSTRQRSSGCVPDRSAASAKENSA
jgi:hypothetical protein